MITVFYILNEYCKEKELPPPSKNDLTNIGNMVGFHFRHFFAMNHIDENGIVPDAGFILQTEGENKFIVTGYPDNFKSETIATIERFYQKKGEDKRGEEKERPLDQPIKGQRKRIPAKPIKVVIPGKE